MAASSPTTQLTQSPNEDELEEDDEGVPQIVVNQVIYLSVMAVFATIANLIVIVKSVLHQRRLSTQPGVALNTTNTFVISLAVSDLGTSTFSVAVFILPSFFPEFPITEFFCKYIMPLRELFFAVSIFSVAFIAVGRYLILLKAFRAKLTLFSSCMVNNAVLWFLSYLIFALPFSTVYKVDFVDGASICEPIWKTPLGRRVHRTFIVVANIFLPTMMVCLSYIAIMRRIRRVRMMVVPQEMTESNQPTTNTETIVSLTAQSHRVVKISLLLLAAFLLTYLPYLLLMLLVEYGEVDGESFPQLEIVHAVALCLLYSCSLINPVIMIFSSDLYRPKFTFIKKPFTCSTV